MPMGILELFVETIIATGVTRAYGVVRDSLKVLIDPLKQVVWIFALVFSVVLPARAQQSDELRRQLQQLKHQDEQVAKRGMGHAVSR
jgi:hypothetical protein